MIALHKTKLIDNIPQKIRNFNVKEVTDDSSPSHVFGLMGLHLDLLDLVFIFYSLVLFLRVLKKSNSLKVLS